MELAQSCSRTAWREPKIWRRKSSSSGCLPSTQRHSSTRRFAGRGGEALTTDGEGGVVNVTDEVVLKLKEEIEYLAASALAFMGFFLRHRFLPFFDMVSTSSSSPRCAPTTRRPRRASEAYSAASAFDGGDARRVCFVLGGLLRSSGSCCGLSACTCSRRARQPEGFPEKDRPPRQYYTTCPWVVDFESSALRKVFAGMPMLPVFICVDLS